MEASNRSTNLDLKYCDLGGCANDCDESPLKSMGGVRGSGGGGVLVRHDGTSAQIFGCVVDLHWPNLLHSKNMH